MQLTEQIRHTVKLGEGLSPGAHCKHWEQEGTSASLGKPPPQALPDEHGSNINQF